MKRRWSRWSLAVRELVLAGAMILAWGVLAPVAYHLGGWGSVAMAALAAGVCLIGTALALAASHLLLSRGPVYGLVGFLVSITLRTGLPIVLLMVVHLQDGLQNRVSIVYYLLFFYLFALTIETFLSLPSLRQSNPAREI